MMIGVLIGSLTGRCPPTLVAICTDEYVGNLTAEYVGKADEPGHGYLGLASFNE